MYVDMRLRPPLPSWITKQQFSNENAEGGYRPAQMGYPRPPSAVARSMDMLLKEMDEAGINWGVIMGRQTTEPNGIIPNDEIFDCVNKYPDRFVGWVGLDLSRGPAWWLEEIRRCVKFKGCKGVAIEPTNAINFTTRRADDRALYPIYEECVRLDLPVSITLSAIFQAKPGLRMEDSSPFQIFQVARDFPKLQIVVAHGGWPLVAELIAVAFACRNVWISPDEYGVPEMAFAQEYVKGANLHFKDRTLFGTAYPSRPLRETVEAYKKWDWGPGVFDKVMYQNACRLMRLD